MKNAKRENAMKKIAVAALILGIYSPLAQAAISPKDGVSAEELSQIVQDLEVQKVGNSIRFAGLMPKRCAESVIPLKAEYKDNKHIIKISIPACDDNFKFEAGKDELVDAADFLNEVKLKDADGEIVLRHYKAGSRLASDRIQDESLTDKSGKALPAHLSHASVEEKRLNEEQAQKQKELEEEELSLNKERVARLQDLQSKVVSFCKEGDLAGLGQEIEAAADVLEDVNEYMEKVAGAEMKSLLAKIKNAESSEEAKDAYEAFVAGAETKDWDADAAKKAYIEKRFAILDTLAADAKSKPELIGEADREIRAWVTELRENKAEFRRNEAAFAKLYGELGTYAAKRGDVEKAVSFYDKGKEYADANGKINADKEAAKAYAKMFQDCLKKNPNKMEACDQYAEQAQARMSNAGDQLVDSGTEEEVQAFKADYIAAFGSGVTVSAPGIGKVSPYQAGALDQLKQQAYRDEQARKAMAMQVKQQQCAMQPQTFQACMMQAQMEMSGGQAAAPSPGNFLGLK